VSLYGHFSIILIEKQLNTHQYSYFVLVFHIWLTKMML